jgi:phosphate butyryltransferase
MITRVEEMLAVAKNVQTAPRVVLAGAENQSALETVVLSHERGLAEGVLVGKRQEILKSADELSIDVSPLEVVDRQTPAECVATALDIIKAGKADILVKGNVSTHVLLRGVLDKKYGFRTDRALSHISAFNVPGEDRILIITDAGVNVQPDLQRKRDILINAVDLAHALGFERPRVAVMSFVEEVTDPHVRSQADADDLRKMYLNGSITGCVVEGPYSLDVALSVEAARIKSVEGEVAGRADIIVMHDLGMVTFSTRRCCCG